MTALFTGIAGKVVDAIWPGGGSPTRNTSEIARFDGIAGHLAEARALLDFFDQDDDDIVYLEVGPKLSPSGRNVVAEEVPVQGGTAVKIREISLMTKCPPSLPLER